LKKQLRLIKFTNSVLRALRCIVISRFSIADANRTSYNSLISAEAYSNKVSLKKAEQEIHNLLKQKSPLNKMLDIGIGGGRTTHFFSQITKEYIGVDYCENMVKVCREKFYKYPNVSFAIADARDLSVYKDDTFDFVLFSFGGLDAVEHEDRIRILCEIIRILKEGAFFCFSTSNLDALSQFCQIKLEANAKIIGEKAIALLLTRMLNPEMWVYCRGQQRNLKHMMYNIGGDFWSLKTYCITTSEQLRQLKDAGFIDVKIYNSKGRITTCLHNTTDIELHFLAKKPVTSKKL
jgi:ubiquinone/menaquinone biosynthesis C-methylase UbiE